jgi:hypothetical protein
MKLCECGCGEPAPIALRTQKSQGAVKGQPQRFIRGHIKRNLIPPTPPNPSGFCFCGCGGFAPIAKRTDKLGSKVRGEPQRYIVGHWCRSVENLKHGLSRKGHLSIEFVAYQSARRRCTNPQDQAWANYGGRGIKFLFNSFQDFIAEIGLRPSSLHSLDRYPNNDGNYEPGNVRWATRKEQTMNRRPKSLWKNKTTASQEVAA